MKQLLSTVIAILLIVTVLFGVFHLLQSNDILDVNSYFDSIKSQFSQNTSSSSEIKEDLKIILELESITF